MAFTFDCGIAKGLSMPVDTTNVGLWPAMEIELGDAAAWSDGERLTMRAGGMQRSWRWSRCGPHTMAIVDLKREAAFHAKPASEASDWQLPDGTEPADDAELVSLEGGVVTDDPLTAEHLRVEAIVLHRSQGIRVRWVLMLYPDVAGIRSELAAWHEPGPADIHHGGVAETGTPGTLPDARVDRLPLAQPPRPWLHPRLAAGYYVGTQDRNASDTPLLRTEASRTVMWDGEVESYPWANLLTVETPGGAVTVVKESHRGVNQPGYDAGTFAVDRGGLEVTGWGLQRSDLETGHWQRGWATWTLLHPPGELARQRAIKRFERVRYPIEADRDLPTMVNLWGSSDSAESARDLADESEVLEAIDRAADLGIECVQIDDGWQTPPGATAFSEGDWRPHPERYPEGWTRVRERADARGVDLGLWAAWTIPAERLEENRVAGGFKHFKLDFMVLDTHAKLHGLMDRVDRVVRNAQPPVRVNWDLTERSPRVGSYFGREYGSVYLANRKPRWPQRIVYVPHLMLRDAWHLAHYTNLQKFQISTTNLDRCDPGLSNAAEHGHDYALAVTLMGSPLWFCHPREISDAAAAAFRPLLDAYKRERPRLARCVVYPIGDEPDDRRWTGFQAHDEDDGSGYLLVFRERHCPHPQATMRLALALALGRDKPLLLTDLLTGDRREPTPGDGGTLDVEARTAPGFQFIRYEPSKGSPRGGAQPAKPLDHEG